MNLQILSKWMIPIILLVATAINNINKTHPMKIPIKKILKMRNTNLILAILSSAYYIIYDVSYGIILQVSNILLYTYLCNVIKDRRIIIINKLAEIHSQKYEELIEYFSEKCDEIIENGGSEDELEELEKNVKEEMAKLIKNNMDIMEEEYYGKKKN